MEMNKSAAQERLRFISWVGEVTTVAKVKNTASSSATGTAVWKELGMNWILSKEEVLQLAERIKVM